MKRYRAVFLALILPFIAFAEPTPFTEKESAVHAAATDAGPAGNSASGRVQNLEAERIIELEPLQTVIAVRSNVQGAAVYLNREYQGVTPLTVSGLTPGVYELHVEKTGFTDCTYLIYLSEGRSFSYFVPLERNVGFLDLSALPPDAEVFVDSERITDTYIEKDEGWHHVRVRKFGFKDAFGKIFLRARTVKSLSVSMTQDEFRIQSFAASKPQFNPDYTGSLGVCVFTAVVTAPETGALVIKSADGTDVFRAETGEFSTWEQNIPWNGRRADGRRLAEGRYTAEFSAGGQTSAASFRIDYSLFYRLADVSAGGSGIGRIPAAFMLPKNTTLLSLNAGATFRTDSGFHSVPVGIAAAFVPVRFLELSAHFALDAGESRTSVSGGGAIKLAHEQPVGKNLNLCIGGAARYGFSEKKRFPPFGVDSGNGLGAAAMVAVDNKTFYSGIASSVTLGAEDGLIGRKDAVWKNAAAVSLMPTAHVACNAWFAVDSAFNFSAAEQKTRIPVAFARAFDTGIGSSFVLPGSSVVLTASLSALIFRSAPAYIETTIGITYLF